MAERTTTTDPIELQRLLREANEEVNRLNIQARTLTATMLDLANKVDLFRRGQYVIDETTTAAARAAVADANQTERPKHLCKTQPCDFSTEGWATLREKRNFRHQWDPAHVPGGRRLKCLICGDVTEDPPAAVGPTR